MRATITPRNNNTFGFVPHIFTPDHIKQRLCFAIFDQMKSKFYRCLSRYQSISTVPKHWKLCYTILSRSFHISIYRIIDESVFMQEREKNFHILVQNSRKRRIDKATLYTSTCLCMCVCVYIKGLPRHNGLTVCLCGRASIFSLSLSPSVCSSQTTTVLCRLFVVFCLVWSQREKDNHLNHATMPFAYIFSLKIWALSLHVWETVLCLLLCILYGINKAVT